MGDVEFKHQFSKYLTKSAVSAMKSLENLPTTEAKYKMIDLYYMISESMVVALEEYIKIEDKAQRDAYVSNMEARIGTLSNQDFEDEIENLGHRFQYNGKDTPEA